MLALTALVLSSLNPVAPLSTISLGQAKVQIIKGKKGTVKAAHAATEGAPLQGAPESPGSAARAQELDRKAAELEAKNRDLAQREQALQDKESTALESEKKKADQQKALQKHIEKIGEQNQQMMQQASDSLAGD